MTGRCASGSSCRLATTKTLLPSPLNESGTSCAAYPAVEPGLSSFPFSSPVGGSRCVPCLTVLRVLPDDVGDEQPDRREGEHQEAQRNHRGPPPGGRGGRPRRFGRPPPAACCFSVAALSGPVRGFRRVPRSLPRL